MKSRIVPTAEQFVGWVKEQTGCNDGPHVEAIQRVTGNKRGDPWCSSFVTFVLDIAYRGKNPMKRTASCDVLLEDARAKGWLVKTPEAGDLFLVMNPKNAKDAVHVGIVTAVGKTTLSTIEGNTSGDGRREGWGVFARKRNPSGLMFIRLPKE